MSEAVLSNIQQINVAIEEYKQKGCNVVGNIVLTKQPDYVTPILSVVQISTKLEDMEIYPIAGGKYGLSSKGLGKLKIAARITIDNAQVACDPTKRDTIRAAVVAHMIGLDGMEWEQQATKTYDLAVREEEARIKFSDAVAEDKYGKYKGKSADEKALIIAKHVRSTMLQERKFAEDKAVTGAEGRAITKLLGLKSAFTLQELAKPFVFIAMRREFDWTDDYVKHSIMDHWAGVQQRIYPPVNGSTMPRAAAVSFVDDTEELERAEAPAIEIQPTSAVTHEPAAVPKSVSVGFINFPRRTREQVVQKLIDRSGKAADKPVISMADTELVEMYDKLAA